VRAATLAKLARSSAQRAWRSGLEPSLLVGSCSAARLGARSHTSSLRNGTSVGVLRHGRDFTAIDAGFLQASFFIHPSHSVARLSPSFLRKFISIISMKIS
jgi:hypothetical protein